MSILNCQLVELQFESICSEIDFSLLRNLCFYPLICHASKKKPVEVQGGEQWTAEKSTVDGRQTIINCTKYPAFGRQASMKYGFQTSFQHDTAVVSGLWTVDKKSCPILIEVAIPLSKLTLLPLPLSL